MENLGLISVVALITLAVSAIIVSAVWLLAVAKKQKGQHEVFVDAINTHMIEFTNYFNSKHDTLAKDVATDLNNVKVDVHNVKQDVSQVQSQVSGLYDDDAADAETITKTEFSKTEKFFADVNATAKEVVAEVKSKI